MKKQVLSLLLITGLLSACDKKTTNSETTTTQTTATEKDLSASDLVTNPNTATEGEVKTDGKVAKMQFEESEYDFGNIKAGDVVTHIFKFKNTGEAPLIIENASASCGCTVPEYPKEPIQPGEEGKITVKFNSQGKSGQQSKQVTIMANTQPNITTLTIKGNIPNLETGPVKQ